MNQVLMLLVLGGLLLLLAWLVVSSLTTLASPSSPRRGLRGVLARVICPETGSAARVDIAVVQGEHGSRSDVVRCERFPSDVITCARACLQPSEEAAPLAASPATV